MYLLWQATKNAKYCKYYLSLVVVWYVGTCIVKPCNSVVSKHNGSISPKGGVFAGSIERFT
jgi:hypothetical protein